MLRSIRNNLKLMLKSMEELTHFIMQLMEDHKLINKLELIIKISPKRR